MNVVGRGGTRLAGVWADGPQTYLGLTVHGFPNLFIITGPQRRSVLTNMPPAIEDRVDFSAEAIAHLAANGYDTVEATAQARQEWVAHTDELAADTLLPASESDWYVGGNVPGEPRRGLVYPGRNTGPPADLRRGRPRRPPGLRPSTEPG
ncbi:hypothetical protein [Saccharopolyspora gloriosae]|uniref:hypothetical protein n=1 Tax=Saccharopolyspora gloriosae TaxID=455344 RepID=UPI001FB803E1|nr:hypothetical protein [Saccharopolyspora gloriosae]